MNQIKALSVSKKFKKAVVGFLIFTSLLSFMGVIRVFALDNFAIYVSSVNINNYDIDLSNFDNPLIWSGYLTYASSGTIRGISGVTVSTLSGNNLYQGFNLRGTASAYKQLHFGGNIDFTLFRATLKGGAIYAAYSSISFINSSVSFNSNSGPSGGAIATTYYSNTSFTNSSVSFN
ncbi:MAG: hypothetical protein LBN20_01110, partial [Endomicrobium sp.]|nr:hypothetical protein [Endomicrobium sp.]